SGGTLNANGAINAAGGFSWTAGTLGGTAGLSNSGTLDLGSGGTKTINTTLTNTATLTITGSQNVSLGLSGVIVNQAGATIDWQTTAALTGSGSVSNFGTFKRTTSALGMTIGVAFTNQSGGLVDAQSGTINFNGG